VKAGQAADFDFALFEKSDNTTIDADLENVL